MRWWGGSRRRLRSLGGLWVPLAAAVLIMCLGTLGSIVFGNWWGHTVATANNDRLNRSVSSRINRITDNLTRYLDASRAVGAFMQTGAGGAGGTLGRGDQWASFINSMDIQHRYAAMQAIGWQIPVSAPGATGPAGQLSRAGSPDLTITPPGRRTRYAVLVYQHGTEPAVSAPGADRRADPGVSAALDRSVDTGKPAMVPAPAAADRDGGVYWLFLPVFRTADAGTVSARRAGLLGWVSAQIRIDRFLTEALSGIAPGSSGVQLLDDTGPIAADPDGFHPTGRYARSADLSLAGRRWRLGLAPLPGSPSIQDSEPTAGMILLGGTALSLLLAAMTVMIAVQARGARALRIANQRSADMVAMLSHDARQPLTTIINYSQLVLEDWQDAIDGTAPGDSVASVAPADAPAEAAGPRPATGPRPAVDSDIPASLERVIGAAHRLNTLVDDVLATARLDAVPTHNARPVLVGQIIAEAVSDSGAPGMLIETTAVQPVWAHADPTHLRQITANLIGNALKYGAPPVTITAHPTTGGQVTIEISDAGPGVPAEFVGRLFDRFTRATSTTAQQGSGFGLYLVQRLVEANDGHISYRPGQPIGACFTVTLPAAADIPTAAAETAQTTT